MLSIHYSNYNCIGNIFGDFLWDSMLWELDYLRLSYGEILYIFHIERFPAPYFHMDIYLVYFIGSPLY